MTEPDILVLRQKVHGMSPSSYGAKLRDRLPDHEVAVATTPDEERDLIQRARVATGIHFDTSWLDHAENLDLFACAYAGTGHLDIDALADAGVAVTNAAGVHGPNISEYVIGALVAHERQFRRAREQQERNHWQAYPVRELYDSTAAVVGLGAIGEALVERLDAFGVDTIGVRYTPEKGGPTDEVVGFDSIHSALARADYVILACPLTDTTRGLIDADALASMRTDALLVNVARGPIVDTDDLVTALRDDDIRAATLDVTDPEPLPADHPLWSFENVQITPHNAGNTPKYYDRLADILATNLRRIEETGETAGLENQVV
ncbi:D-2-hydroxyacid dehydrogenase [Haloplanus aerogenes]|uniref:D-2-hydroxyacid dehydrogenase n=1 Tax=Haloplanus aerogenes TaxID=660522 RepID=A0A3M0CXC4_9EURY|nr:D-2-hydroxyacid dehydrogenase [Haloplanus aerogenes]AZH25178.1 D-2-hydroxyacid dehydrogenase [Haloplanus aerogenes]RMB13594.1 phosphoglycerate dehydrogenase-like enzyme [Haloplanus aerogenes]